MHTIETLQHEIAIITKWQWILLELKVYMAFLSATAKGWSTHYEFDSRPNGRILCVIANSCLNAMISEGAPRAQLLELAIELIDCEKQQLMLTLNPILDAHDPIVFDDLFDYRLMEYGENARTICEVCGSNVEWQCEVPVSSCDEHHEGNQVECVYMDEANSIEMLKNRTCDVTKWMWIKLELKLHMAFIYATAKDHVISFLFDQRSDGRSVCVICDSAADKMIAEGIPLHNQMEIYKDWVEKEKRQIEHILAPILSGDNDPTINDLFVFEIIESGYDPQTICEIHGQHVKWLCKKE